MIAETFRRGQYDGGKTRPPKSAKILTLHSFRQRLPNRAGSMEEKAGSFACRSGLRRHPDTLKHLHSGRIGVLISGQDASAIRNHSLSDQLREAGNTTLRRNAYATGAATRSDAVRKALRQRLRHHPAAEGNPK